MASTRKPKRPGRPKVTQYASEVELKEAVKKECIRRMEVLLGVPFDKEKEREVRATLLGHKRSEGERRALGHIQTLERIATEMMEQALLVETRKDRSSLERSLETFASTHLSSFVFRHDVVELTRTPEPKTDPLAPPGIAALTREVLNRGGKPNPTNIAVLSLLFREAWPFVRMPASVGQVITKAANAVRVETHRSTKQGRGPKPLVFPYSP